MARHRMCSSLIFKWYFPGILHKGDGTNIYLKEKPKKLVTILGSGQRRRADCDGCNGPAIDNRLLAPVALASSRDGSLYVWDYNFIRKLSPSREEIASILQIGYLNIFFLTHCKLSNNSCFCSLLTFFKFDFFKKFYQE